MNKPWWRNQRDAIEAIQAIVHAAEKRGYITYDQFAEVMPRAGPDLVEDLLTMFGGARHNAG